MESASLRHCVTELRHFNGLPVTRLRQCATLLRHFNGLQVMHLPSSASPLGQVRHCCPRRRRVGPLPGEPPLGPPRHRDRSRASKLIHALTAARLTIDRATSLATQPTPNHDVKLHANPMRRPCKPHARRSENPKLWNRFAGSGTVAASTPKLGTVDRAPMLGRDWPAHPPAAARILCCGAAGGRRIQSVRPDERRPFTSGIFSVASLKIRSNPTFDPLAPFAVGDVVELRSGGPRMTVLRWEVPYWPNEAGAACGWFVQGAQRQGVFPVATLRRAGKARPGAAVVARGIAAAAPSKPLAVPPGPDLKGCPVGEAARVVVEPLSP